MEIAVCRIYSVGEITSWAKQLYNGLTASKVVSITFEPNVTKFCENVFPPTHLPVVFVENSPDSRKTIIKLRQSNKRMFIIWYGKAFSKEDMTFALEARVYTIFENARADDDKLHDGIRKIANNVTNAEQFEQLVHSLKALLLQGESEEALKPLINEFKTAIGKIERVSMVNEFTGGRPGTGADIKLPFYNSEDLSDALSTVHDLERTGVLTVKGTLPGQDGIVEFLTGKIVSASTGEARGLKAIYRMFLWDEPSFNFSRKDPREVQLEEKLFEPMKSIRDEGAALRVRFMSFRHELPPAELKLELEPSALHAGSRLTPEEFSTLASVVELNKVSQVIDYNPLPDVILYEALIKLKKANYIRLSTAA